MSTKHEHRYTAEEYLAIDRASDTKSEYVAGIIYAMGGASPTHVQITGNIAGELRQRLREKPCIVYSTDLRVRASSEGLYAYPDVAVCCGEPRFIDAALNEMGKPRYDQLMLPNGRRQIAAVLEQQGAPVQALIFATYTTGESRGEDIRQVNYGLSMELVNIATGVSLMDMSRVSKEYTQ